MAEFSLSSIVGIAVIVLIVIIILVTIPALMKRSSETETEYKARRMKLLITVGIVVIIIALIPMVIPNTVAVDVDRARRGENGWFDRFKKKPKAKAEPAPTPANPNGIEAYVNRMNAENAAGINAQWQQHMNGQLYPSE